MCKTRHLKYAVNQALENEGIRNQFKMACALVYKKYIISIGNNQLKTHPMQSEYSKNEDSIYLHAEIDAIRKALQIISREQLAQCDMYIARVKRADANTDDYVTGLAKPCKGCQKAIRKFGIKNVFYTEDYYDLELQNYEEIQQGSSNRLLV